MPISFIIDTSIMYEMGKKVGSLMFIFSHKPNQPVKTTEIRDMKCIW